MKRILFFVFLNLFLSLVVMARQQNLQAAEQTKYLIYFTNKNGTPYSIQAPQEFLSEKSIARRIRQQIPITVRDLPVNPAYVKALKEAGATVWYTSRWFNAAVVQATPEVLDQISNLPFVANRRSLNRIGQQETAAVKKQTKSEAIQTGEAFSLSTEADYGRSFHQANMLGGLDLHKMGFKGEGMTIAVLDAGFPGVNTIPAFEHLYQNNQLQGSFDFVAKSTNVYTASNHGTAVLSTMAAYAPGKMIGTAYKANYLLLRTENAASEHNIEEINWLLGAEYADSAGADVINSSLGYHTFDAPSVSYTYQQIDGNTALVSKAADQAAAVGILVVVSAGNDGNSNWRYIAAPADGDSVLAVGAVDSLGVKASFSSFGPTADNRIKPDVVALGLNAYVLNASGNLIKSNGTSFAGPIMAGFATTLWQAYSSRTNIEMISLIRQIGSKARNPDNMVGYGIPNYKNTVTALPDALEEQQVIVVNPVRENQLMLHLGQKWLRQQVQIRVYDVAGRLVWQEVISADKSNAVVTLKATQLKQGMYMCRLQAGALQTTVRFVKL